MRLIVALLAAAAGLVLLVAAVWKRSARLALVGGFELLLALGAWMDWGAALLPVFVVFAAWSSLDSRRQARRAAE